MNTFWCFGVLGYQNSKNRLNQQENYREELTLMVERGQKAELEALYHNGFDYLEKYIVKKIIQFKYIWKFQPRVVEAIV